MSRQKIAKRALYSMLANQNVKDTGIQLIKESIKMDVQWFEDATEASEFVEILEHEEKVDRYEKWLIEQVLPSIQTRVKLGKSIDAIEQFTRTLMLDVFGDLG